MFLGIHSSFSKHSLSIYRYVANRLNITNPDDFGLYSLIDGKGEHISERFTSWCALKTYVYYFIPRHTALRWITTPTASGWLRHKYLVALISLFSVYLLCTSTLNLYFQEKLEQSGQGVTFVYRRNDSNIVLPVQLSLWFIETVDVCPWAHNTVQPADSHDLSLCPLICLWRRLPK